MTNARDESEGGPPYPKSRRAYRILGLIHAPLFGAILARTPFANGEYLIAAVAFIVAGGLTLGVFWHLANEHYCGNVPGKQRWGQIEEQENEKGNWLERISTDCESDWPTLLWRAYESEHVEGLKVKHQGKWYRIEEGEYIGPQLVEEQEHD